MEMLLSGRLRPTKYPERAKDVHSNNGIAWSGWVIKAHIIGFAIVLHSFASLSQENNLVPNPSFESYTDCPDSEGAIWNAESWMFRSSVDYYHECGTNGFGIPVSYLGGGGARTGRAYVGLITRGEVDWGSEFREYAVVPLSRPLSTTRYLVTFYVSFGDSVWYAGKNIGAYLSVGPPSENFDSLLALEAQVNYTGEEFLTDKLGWTRIEGVYLAQGGENYLTIGNFDNDAGSESIYVEGGGVLRPWAPDYWKSAYYFIDDVSVIDMDSLVGIGETQPATMSIFPNPAQEFFEVETDQSEGGTVQLVDMAGRQVAVTIQPQSTGKWHVDIANIPPGIYLLEVQNTEGRKSVQKVLVQH